MIRGRKFVLLCLHLDFASDCNSGRLIDDRVRFNCKIFRNSILSWWRHDFLLSQNVIQKMPGLHLFVDSINDGLLHIVVPQFHLVTWDALLIIFLVAHPRDFCNREFILPSLRSFGRSRHLHRELPVGAWCTLSSRLRSGRLMQVNQRVSWTDTFLVWRLRALHAPWRSFVSCGMIHEIVLLEREVSAAWGNIPSFGHG